MNRADIERASDSLKTSVQNKNKNNMKLNITKPSRKIVLKTTGIAIVTILSVYGALAAYHAGVAFTNRKLDSYALNRVEKNSALNSQLTATVVKVPVIDPAATSELESSLKNAASQGASDGASTTIKDSLK